MNAGVHMRQIVKLEKMVNKIVTSSTRLMCGYDNDRKVAIAQFNDQ